jgi:hypothetical protein
MTQTPEELAALGRVWICPHVGEYGRYYPEAVEAEGEHGGGAVEYVPATALTALQAERDAAVARAEKAEGALKPFALLDFETTEDAWDAFYQASGHTWIDYDHICAARAALSDAKGE